MKSFDDMPDGMFVFGTLMVLSNRIDTLLERELKKFGVTSRQWYLCLVLGHLFDEPPTLKELARAMGTSYQNVKQVALKLEEKGLVVLRRDERDARVTRIVQTESAAAFWQQTEGSGQAFIQALMGNLDAADLAGARRVNAALMDNLDAMDSE